MPYAPLVIATLAPLLVLMAVPDVGRLADLYAIGVVGAVAINLGTCATNMQVDIRRWERAGMGILATLMVAIWLTIAWEKPEALLFAMTVLAVGMTLRWTVHHWDRIRGWLRVPTPAHATVAPKEAAPPSVQIVSEPAAEVVQLPPGVSRIMVATYGSRSLVRLALQEAKAKNAELLVLFVRHLAVATMGPANEVDVRDDPEAQAFFEGVAEDAQADGVDSRFLYAVASRVSSAILSLATTSGVDELILGESRRGPVWRAVKGNTNRRVARHLPKGIRLVIHQAEQ
jgi:nucleotide-binding universal stress UspA family protein